MASSLWAKRLERIAAVLFVAAALAHLLWSLHRISSTLAPDFSIFYHATRDVVAGINPYTDTGLYTVYNYPVITNILYLPLSYLPYHVAQAIYVYISALAVIAIVYLSDRIVFPTRSLIRLCVITGLAFEAFPVKFTLGMGQSNALAFFLLLTGFRLWQRDRHLPAGFLVGLAILYKPILAFFLLFFVIYKAWRVMYGTAAVLAGSLAVVLALDRINLLAVYGMGVLQPLMTQNGRGVYYNQGVTGFAGRLPVSPFLQVCLAALFSVFVLFLASKRLRRTAPAYVFALLTSLLPLIHTLSWQHHFLILILPFLTALYASRSPGKKLALGIAYVLVAGNIRNPALFSRFPLSLVLSHAFFGGCILFLLLYSNRALHLSKQKRLLRDTMKA